MSTVGEHQEITYVPTSALKAAAAEAAAAAATNCQKQEVSHELKNDIEIILFPDPNGKTTYLNGKTKISEILICFPFKF